MPLRMPRARVVVLAVAVLALAGVGVTALLADEADDASASTTTTTRLVEVTIGAVSETVAVTGTLAPAASESLSFGAAGTVTSVAVAEGDEISAGDVLATLDSAELASAVAEAEADLASAEATLADHVASGASDAQVEASETAVAVAEDRLAVAAEDLAGAEIVAGIDGVVTGVTITEGEQLGTGGTSGTGVTGAQSAAGAAQQAGTTAHVTVQSRGAYEVVLPVDVTQVDQVAVGQAVAVSPSNAATGGQAGGLQALARRFGGGQQAGGQQAGGQQPVDSSATATGEVVDVAALADASSGVATYDVTVTFEGDPDTFFVGATVEATITISEVEDAVLVPAQAVETGEDGTATVTVDVDGARETREVVLGATSAGQVQVVSGVAPGETVVVETVTVAPTGDAEGQGQLPEGIPQELLERGFPGGGQGGGFRQQGGGQ